MKKSDAKELFGGRYVRMAEELTISKQALSEWPEELTIRQRNEIVGAAVMCGKIKGARLPGYLHREQPKR